MNGVKKRSALQAAKLTGLIGLVSTIISCTQTPEEARLQEEQRKRENQLEAKRIAKQIMQEIEVDIANYYAGKSEYETSNDMNIRTPQSYQVGDSLNRVYPVTDVFNHIRSRSWSFYYTDAQTKEVKEEYVHGEVKIFRDLRPNQLPYVEKINCRPALGFGAEIQDKTIFHLRPNDPINETR